MGELYHLITGYTSTILGHTWEGHVSAALRNGLGSRLQQEGVTFIGDLRFAENTGGLPTPDYLFAGDASSIAADAKAGGYAKALAKVTPLALYNLIRIVRGHPLLQSLTEEDRERLVTAVENLQPREIIILQPEEAYTRPFLQQEGGTHYFYPAGSLERVLNRVYPFLFNEAPSFTHYRPAGIIRRQILTTLGDFLHISLPYAIEDAYFTLEETLPRIASQQNIRRAYAALLLNALRGSRDARKHSWRVFKVLARHGPQQAEEKLERILSHL